MPIVDFGMARNVHKSNAFAFLKGLVDSGLKIKHEEKTFPDEGRIRGVYLKKDFSKNLDKIKSNIEKEFHNG